LDAGRHAQQHPLPYAGSLGDEREPRELFERVDDDAADAVRHRPFELGDGLVVAVEDDPLARYAGALRNGELAARADIEPEPIGEHPARDRRTQEGLARVVDVTAVEGGAPLRAPATKVGLIEEVGRSAV